jgi:hypothetical protein
MIQELLTYSTQKVKIKALRGNKFELTVNVRTSSGANFDFTNSSTETDNGYFEVFQTNGSPFVQSYTGLSISQSIDFDVKVSDGEIVISSENDNGFWPAPGTYKYSLYTEKVDSADANSNLTYWLHGDFVVVDDNPATTLGGVPTVGEGIG